ncbi:hypothetical protein IQ22_00014 [Pseudomonas duriflava]|uniref:Uncharacterized protein n=1 Tax=Pseudomonas duriflava TaxID=459528 RepID=A0A562QQ31_9PSED|nr:hypothetical protein IQ22_00014 [Pseudomonas duriflava]
MASTRRIFRCNSVLSNQRYVCSTILTYDGRGWNECVDVRHLGKGGLVGCTCLDDRGIAETVLLGNRGLVVITGLQHFKRVKRSALYQLDYVVITKGRARKAQVTAYAFSR